jgi:hypothetical protein
MTMRLATRCSVLAFVASSLGCGPSSGTSADGGTPEAGNPDGSAPEAGSPEGGACVEGGSLSWDTQATRVDSGRGSIDIGAGLTNAAHIDFDNAGNAIAVWAQIDASGVASAWASRRTRDGQWSAPQQISTTPVSTGSGTGMAAALAVSGDGSAIAVWQQYGGLHPTGVQNVWAVRYQPGSGWSAEMAIQAPAAGPGPVVSSDPQVAIDSKGNAVVVWSEDDSQQDNGTPAPDFGTQTYANRYVAGTGWSGPVLVSNFGANGSTENPQVAVDEQGDAVVAWSASPGNSPIRAMAARYDGTSAKWEAGAFIDQCTACNSNLGIVPSVAIDSSRNAFALWAQGQSGGTVATFAARYGAASGTWANAMQLDANLGTNLNAQGNSERIVLDNAGNATAVWVNISNDQTHPNTIIASRFTGGAWQAAAPIDTKKPGGNTRPYLAIDDVGDVMAVWDDQGSVWATEYGVATGTWPQETQLDPQDNSAGFPSVAFSHGCPTALVAYVNATGQNGNNGSGVFVRSFH